MPSREENQLRFQMGNMPLLKAPNVDAIALHWYRCNRIEEGHSLPPQPAFDLYGSSLEIHARDPCEGAFDPYYWKTGAFRR